MALLKEQYSCHGGKIKMEVKQNRSVRAPAPRPQVMVQDNTRVATPSVKVDSSNLSRPAEKPNPFSSFTSETSSVKVDSWKKGKNDSLEGILKNQGYSLSEIYSKDTNGKSLVDKVAAANKLKNPNVIRPGQELVVPSKEDSESLSSKDLGNGHSQTASVKADDVSIEAKMDKAKDGTTTATTTAKADDASLSSQTTVSEKGRVDTSISKEGDAVKAQSVAISGDSTAVSQVDTKTKPGSTSVAVSDLDSNKNLSVTADSENVEVTNKARTKGDNVTTNVDISESSSDGWFENTGRSVYNWFGGETKKPDSVSLTGASEVKATKNDEGQATVTAKVDGKNKTLLETAGDSDDSWLERAGESVDNFWGSAGDFFSGDKETTSKSQVTRMTRRGRRAVK